MLLCLLLTLCVTGALTTGVSQIDIDSALNRYDNVVLTGLRVYRDEIVVLDTYGGVITVGAVNMTVRNSLFDTLSLAHVYSTVDDVTGNVAVCTNRKGRCQYMDVNTLQVLGFGEGLILEGEQEVEVDQGVLLLIANTSNNVPSLYTASENGVTIGQTGDNPEYPIRAAQLKGNLTVDARLLAVSQTEDFNRKYIAMFRAEGFVYTVSDDGLNIRVTRICESDSLALNRFHSLYQAKLAPCVATVSPDVLDARLIVLSDGSESNFVVIMYENLGFVSVCAYSLSSINLAMRATYEKCVVNEMGTVPNQQLFGYSSGLQCSLYSDPSINTECNLWTIVGKSPINLVFMDVGTVTGGTELISNLPVSVGESLVTTTGIHDGGYSYYYLYLVQGNKISKYLMSGLGLVLPPLETLVLSDTITAVDKDQSGGNLFVITNTVLYRIPLDDCVRHSSCVACVWDTDPLCGWCSLQSVCSKRSLCDSYNLSKRWIDTDSAACLSVSAVTPDTSSLNVDTNVMLRARNLPELSEGKYECVFSGGGGTYRVPVSAVNGDTNSTRGPVNGAANITCAVPTGLSSFTKSDTRVYSLYLSTSAHTATLGDVLEYRLVQCGYNTNCSSCVASNATCGWCLYDSTCVPERARCLMEEWVQPTDSQTLCPIVLSTFNTSTLQVAGQEVSNITILGAYLPPPTLLYTYTCALTLTGEGRGGVPGVWRNTSLATAEIDCLVSKDTFPMDGIGSLQLVWGPTNHSINQGTLEFNVFICGNQLDCFSCLTNSECNWCTDANNRSGKCSSACGANMNIFTPSGMCPPPQISGFTPTSTAIGGSLVIEVTGYGMAISGRETTVIIGDIYCSVITANSTHLTCQLQASGEVRSDRLNLTVAGVSAQSQNSFATARPVITDIDPSFTPQSGGSRVALYGTELLVGTNREVTAGEVRCEIINTASNATADTIVCITGASPDPSSPLMSIRIDSMETTYIPEPLTVLEDPQVTNVYLVGVQGTEQQLRQTIVSGVLDYQLRGRNLGATLTQSLVFMQGDREISQSLCIPPTESTASRLTCPGGRFSNVTPSSEGTDVRFELIMDSVPNVTQLFFQVFSFKLYPDPVFVGGALTNQQTITEGDTDIMFEIPNIDKVPSAAISIKQTINNQTFNAYICSIPQFSEKGIRCSLNNTTPTPTPTTTTPTIHIEIEIGLNNNKYVLTITLVIVQKEPIVAFLENHQVTLIGAGVVLQLCLCLLCVFLSVCCCCLASSMLRNRIMKEKAEHLLVDMERIENDMADRFRKGFTEMNDEDEVDDKLFKVGNVPLHNFKTFVMRTLFSGLQDHPVLHPIEKPDNLDLKAFNTGLHEFEQLLHDKRFLLAMIHSMEDNPNFSNTDIRNMASTLTIALFNSMPYLTEILFDLLRELINKTVSKKSPKLLFRGTPSVAERLLTGWLAFNLYSHLQCSPSVSIYELFLRLNRHIMSKPVDIMNGKSTNALSEEKLLLEEIPYTKLDIEIEATKNNKIPCTLLDCDTITQAKIKIMDKLYQGIGFYQRPKLEDVDLMLRLEGRGRQLLRDNDMTNEKVREWRKINTLSHYNIRSGMLLVVVPRKPKPNLGQVWDYPGTAIYDFRDAQSASQLLTLYDTQLNKVFHLQLSEQSEDKMKLKKRATRKRNLRTEVFLPRLLATKAALQKYVDQLMEEIFPNTSVHLLFDEANQIPRAIKLLFDFFDEQRIVYSIEDPDVVHIWKSNSVTLMFWVNILKNPDFLLDVAKGATLDAALSVIAQAVIDSCSPEQYITKDSPTNKLLYYKQVQIYKTRVYKCYEEIRHAPNVHMNSITFPVNVIQARGQDCMFHVDSAVYGLFSYAQSYQEEIRNRLNIENLELQKEIFNEVCLAMT